MAAARFFGPAFDRVTEYVDILRSTGIEHGLIGPREGDRLWSRHILNCAVLREISSEPGQVADVGSGAGLPGIPLALAMPTSQVTLIEPLQRRADFLMATVETLGLADRVFVRRDRAEDCRDILGSFDVVTARAVAPVKKLAGWTVPLARVGGRVVAMKGAKVDDELAAAGAELRRLGVKEWRVRQVGGSVVDPPTTVLELVVGARPEPGRARTRRKGGRPS